MKVSETDEKKASESRRKKKRITSPLKRKILLLLAAGIALGFRRTIGGQLKLLHELSRAWKDLNREYLQRLVREFQRDRFVEWREYDDGTIRVVLSEGGKELIRKFNIETMKLKRPARWDRKWRVVFFDVPEKRRIIRDALRQKLRDLDFYELQKSVFVSPFPCREEIDLISEFFEARSYIRFGELLHLTNEAQIQLYFDLV